MKDELKYEIYKSCKINISTKDYLVVMCSLLLFHFADLYSLTFLRNTSLVISIFMLTGIIAYIFINMEKHEEQKYKKIVKLIGGKE